MLESARTVEARPWRHPEPDPDWHPHVRTIYLHWRAMHPPGALPGRQHFDPLAVARFLPGIWLLDVQLYPFRLRYRLVGTRMVEGIGRDVTGQWMDEAHPELVANPAYLARYLAVCETGTPSWRRGRAQLAIRADFQTLENLLLPLASDGQTVDMILAFTLFLAAAPSELSASV